ncbi:MAG: VTT domain-containing protein [Candidatus Nanohaloarchaea archaeon]|nr:VTT domain-containing protein [Candidatus Nanohaloarchaea archaeon]
MGGIARRLESFIIGAAAGIVPGYLQGSGSVNLVGILWGGPVGGFMRSGYRLLQYMIETYGILAFLAASLLKGLLLFFFAPAESVTPLYVLYAADNLLQVAVIVVVAALTITAGNFVIYLLARFLGERLFTERESAKWRVVEWLAKEHGRSSMYFLRLIPFIGGWAAIPAGVVKMNVRDYLIFTFLGFLTYEGFWAYLAYYGVKVGTLQIPFLP